MSWLCVARVCMSLSVISATHISPSSATMAKKTETKTAPKKGTCHTHAWHAGMGSIAHEMRLYTSGHVLSSCVMCNAMCGVMHHVDMYMMMMMTTMGRERTPTTATQPQASTQQ